jgi:hypothetical protein
MKWLISLLLVIILVRCESTPKLFSSIRKTEDRSYGYTIENPICIGYYSDWKRNTKAAWYFLSKLQIDGHSLRLIRHSSCQRPKNLETKTTLPMRWGNDDGINNLLDRFDLIIRGSNDTTKVVLYFDVILKGEIKIPLGLTYVETSQNDIFQKNK